MFFCNQIYLSIYLFYLDRSVQWKQKHSDMLSGCSGVKGGTAPYFQNPVHEPGCIISV